MTTQLISLSSITIPALKWRRWVAPEHIAELARSISEFGLFQPVVVRAKSDGDLAASQVDELVKLPVEVQIEVLPRVQDAPRGETRAIVAAAKRTADGGNGTDEKAVKRLARLLGEPGPLLEKTNKLMFNILTTAERAGVTGIGWLGSLRTEMELNDLRSNQKKFDETFDKGRGV
jgi:hypothetical protein